MKLIRAKDKWLDVPRRWRATYANMAAGSWHHAVTTKLDALKPEDRDGELMASIIGNRSWTHQNCDVCREEKDTLLRIGEVGYDERGIEICRPCLEAALVKFPQSN